MMNDELLTVNLHTCEGDGVSEANLEPMDNASKATSEVFASGREFGDGSHYCVVS